ncbi:MAG: Tm-1-like ATP-binding domain-containing protein, partial [Nitrososphaerales archaeon]
EVAYLSRLIRVRGSQTIIIDTGILDGPLVEPDVMREEVALAGGRSLAELIAAGNKGQAIATMIAGSRAILSRLCAEGRVVAAIGVGGGQGTAIGAAAMQVLPLGLPKLMVSTIASGQNRFGPYVDTTDMCLMHSVADIAGINLVTRQIFANAAAAITAMAEVAAVPARGTRPAIGATMLGLTTACVTGAREHLERQGYEVVTFHPNGAGGRCMERLLDEGLLQAALDVSLQELTGYICHGLFDAGEDRLVAAGRRGLPQVVVPGGTDYIVSGPAESLPPELKRRPYIVHNPNITLVRTTADEMARVGRLLAERINAANGAAAVLVPTRGLSEANRPGQALYDPDADAALFEALQTGLSARVEFQTIAAHINDAAFARAAAEKMHELIEVNGTQ